MYKCHSETETIKIEIMSMHVHGSERYKSKLIMTKHLEKAKLSN